MNIRKHSCDLKLNAIVYTQYPHGMRKNCGSVEMCWQHIIHTLEQHLQIMQSALLSDGNIRHTLCSTINYVTFASGQSHWPSLVTQFKNRMNYAPELYLDAYECAGWGYALRYLSSLQTKNRHHLISIIDVDFNDDDFWLQDPPWGRSGFGVTTLLFERTSACENLGVVVDCAKTNTPITEFGFAIRKQASLEPDIKILVPFFKADARSILQRILSKHSCFPDLHEQFGHCFGSDPWLSLLQEHHSTSINYPEGKMNNQHYLACSYALNGYYSLVDFKLNDKFIACYKTAGF